ncbi:MAG: RHS repeat protein, partial [Planctomycetes bacterium]|nr:RHS repeat protein [Planctomycetota bacterium]
ALTAALLGGDALLEPGGDTLALVASVHPDQPVTLTTDDPAVFRFLQGAAEVDTLQVANGQGVTLVGKLQGLATLGIAGGTSRAVVVRALQHEVAAQWPTRNIPDRSMFPNAGAGVVLGTGIFRFQVETLPAAQGRNGHAPDWTLTYNSRATSRGGVFGVAAFQMASFMSIARLSETAYRLQDEEGRQYVYSALDATSGLRTTRARYDLLEDTGEEVVLRHPDGLRCRFHPVALPGAPRRFLQGQLKGCENRFGDVLRYEYDARGFLTALVDSLGRRTSFFYDAAGRLERIEEDALTLRGRRVGFIYDAASRLTRVDTTPVIETGGLANAFPLGKPYGFAYDGGSRRIHEVRYPNEMLATPQGPARITNLYDAQGRIERQTEGGTNASGNSAGGTCTYLYESDGAVRLTDRNGNESLHRFDPHGLCAECTVFTNRDLRAADPAGDDPASFRDLYEYNADEQVLRRVHPLGNEERYLYFTGCLDRRGRGNLLEVRRVADAARGGGEPLVTSFAYEPVYQELRTVTSPRGNAMVFPPQTNLPPVRPVDFDLRGTAVSDRRARYTTEFVYDYQEGSADQLQALAARERVLVAPTAALALSKGADLNGDGLTGQTVGRLIERRYPNTLLDDGLTPQAVVENYRYNRFAQLTAVIDAAGYVDEYEYYPERDPDGDGVVNPAAGLAADTGGYLKDVREDAALALRTPAVITKALALLAGHEALARIATERVRSLTTYRYDRVGNVVEEVDPRGVVHRYTVNERNQVQVSVRAAALEAVDGVAPEVHLAALAYTTRSFFDANDNLVETDIENRTGEANLVVAGNDFLTTTRLFDILDNPVEETREVAQGESVALDATHLIPVGAPESVTTRMRYDANENLVLAESPVAVAGLQTHNVSSTRYDERDLPYRVARGGLESTPGPETSIERRFYDANANLVAQVDAEDNGAAGIEGGDVTRTLYDGFDRAVKTTDPMGYESRRSYDPDSNVVGTSRHGAAGGNARGATHRLAEGRTLYDELGRAVRGETDLFGAPGGATEAVYVRRSTFDELSRVLVTTNPRGFREERYYDGKDRLVLRQDHPVAGVRNEWVSTYDKAANEVLHEALDRASDGSGHVEEIDTERRFDALGRVVRTVDSLGNTRRYAYDSRDNPVIARDANASPSGETTLDGHAALNVPGNPVYTVYDGLNRPVLVERELHLDHVGDAPATGRITTRADYDANSRVVERTDDNGNTTRYEFDSLDRERQLTYADLTVHTRAYDRDSNLTTRRDANGTVVTNTLDDLGRLLAEDVARGPGVEGTTMTRHEYDGLSRRTRATDDNGIPGGDSVVDRSYDSLSRIVEERQTQLLFSVERSTFTVRYAYDEQSNLVRLDYPSGRAVARRYDAIDRLEEIREDPGASIASFHYVGPSRERRRTQPGLVRETAYDLSTAAGCDCALGRERSLVYRQGTSEIARFEYDYDRESRRSSESVIYATPERADATHFKRYTYDSAGRLLAEARRPSPLGGFTNNQAPNAAIDPGLASTPPHPTVQNRFIVYDGAQNRRTETTERKDLSSGFTTNTRTFTPGPTNELDAIDGAAIPHDANGNRKEVAAGLSDRAYAFDYKNRPVRYLIQTPQFFFAADYAHDPYNRRVRRIVSDSFSGVLLTELDTYSTGFELLEQYRPGSVVLTKRYTWVGDCPTDDLVQFQSDADGDLTVGESAETFYPLANVQHGVHEFVDGTGALREMGHHSSFDESGVEVLGGFDAFGRNLVTGFVPLTGAPGEPLTDYPFAFQNLRLDIETGSLYARNRQYSPSDGRFLQRDPQGVWTSAMNLGNGYGFAGNGPVSQSFTMCCASVG